ncbi:MAG TPA: glycosyltransferase [Usitatibacter sp.]|nr:glycosyltransferase [Usitatibacter sp.]
MSGAENPVAVAMLLPCFNEEVAIGAVVRACRAALPAATVYVFDNNSTDRTVEVAREAGAVVRHVAQQGKGNVVRRMFADVEADVYVLLDGDGTYDTSCAPAMVAKLLDEGLDMVVGGRVTRSSDAYRAGHRFGNRLFSESVARLFGRGFTDILSGYRVFSRRFVKSFPALARGFEIETELTVHALELRMPVAEVATPYGARPEGSQSKLRTYRDGARILWAICKLFARERPMGFFGGGSALLALAAVALAVPLFITYAETGLVPRLPTAILASAMMLLAALGAVCGLILDTVTLGRLEVKRLVYLGIAGPPARRP